MTDEQKKKYYDMKDNDLLRRENQLKELKEMGYFTL